MGLETTLGTRELNITVFLYICMYMCVCEYIRII
jgi:hypothetical protein